MYLIQGFKQKHIFWLTVEIEKYVVSPLLSFHTHGWFDLFNDKHFGRLNPSNNQAFRCLFGKDRFNTKLPLLFYQANMLLAKN